MIKMIFKQTALDEFSIAICQDIFFIWIFFDEPTQLCLTDLEILCCFFDS